MCFIIYLCLNLQQIMEFLLALSYVLVLLLFLVIFKHENFLKHEVIKSNDSNSPIIVTVNDDDKEVKEETLKSDDKNYMVESKNKSNNITNDLKYYICNKSLQVIVALSVCVIALFSLIIGYDFNLIPEEATPSIIQFRDLISSCVGFLLGCSRTNSNKNSSKK